MNGRSYDDRDMDDIDSPADFRLAKRFYAALLHPDCPVHMFEYEASKLARHLAVRYSRKSEYNERGRMAGSTSGPKVRR